MHWVELGVGILQGDQRVKQGKWLDQATWSMSKTRKVAICCAIKSPQPVKMGLKKASQKGALLFSFLPKNEERESKYSCELKKYYPRPSPLYLMEDSVERYDYIPYGAL